MVKYSIYNRHTLARHELLLNRFSMLFSLMKTNFKIKARKPIRAPVAFLR